MAPHRKRTAGRADPAVGAAAGRLEVGEFELFRLAHRRWHGREAEGDALERAFSAYLRGRGTPFWVRHYAREVLRAGPGDAPPRHGRAILAAACAAFLLLSGLLLGTAPVPAEPKPLSCAGGGPGLVLLENFAYGFAGRARPPC
jgi:hypothetical protein